MVYNPLDREVRKTLTIPLYYTGLTGKATVRQGDQAPVAIMLDFQSRISLPVTVPPRGVAWFIFRD